MKKYSSNLLAISLALLCIYLFWHFIHQPPCPAGSSKSELGETIVIGTNAEYPPFSFLRDGKIVGFDIDVAQEVVKRLGKQARIIDMPFDMLLPGLQVGNIHIIAAGISPKPTRAKHVLFTKPYVEHDPLLIITPVNKPKINSVAELVGKTVVVNDGYTADSYISAQKNVNVQRLATPAQAVLALASGRADAYVAAQSSVQRFLAQHTHQYNTTTVADATDAYALVISPVYSVLLPLVQDALDTMTADGTLTTLKKTWGLA